MMIDEEREQLQSDEEIAYERRVRDELGVRKARVAALDEKLSRIRFELTQLSPEKLLLRGNAREVVQSEVYRKALKEKLVKLQRERKEAQEDFERAEERLRLLRD